MKILNSAAIVLMVAVGAQASVVIETVPVGNVGNAGELSGDGVGGSGASAILGGVEYSYSIAKYEVTVGEYTEFLNAVAQEDTYALYDSWMWTQVHGCKLQRSGSSGSFKYSVDADYANRPVNLVSWGDAARFVNWLHNGQPKGPQGPSTTERGSYQLDGAMTADELSVVTRRPGATWILPSEDEWYKAAYHKNDGLTGNYFDYPTSSDDAPANELMDPDPGNSANMKYQHHYTLGPPYWRTNVGDFENTQSPYGAFDMGGNVFEWNETVIIGSEHGIRGGQYGHHEVAMWAGRRYSSESTLGGYGIGLRVALVPEPSALALLTLGCVLIVGRRKR